MLQITTSAKYRCSLLPMKSPVVSGVTKKNSLKALFSVITPEDP